MSDVRLPRGTLPTLPDLPVEIPAPPPYPDPPDQSLLIAVLPIAVFGVVALLSVIISLGGGSNSPFFLVTLSMFGVSAGVTVYAQRNRQRGFDARKETIRIGYLRALNYKRARLQAAHDARRALLDYAYPPPDATGRRAGQRSGLSAFKRPGDPDFMSFRIGIAALPSPVRISAPDPDRDHPLLRYALELAEDYRTLRDAPAALHLTDGAAGIAGTRAAALDLIRAALIHLAVNHAPADLRIHVIAPAEHADDWRWLEWLPHVSSAQRGGAADLLAFGPENARALGNTLAQSLNERRESTSRAPFLLVVFDAHGLPPLEAMRTILADGPQLGASALVLTESPDGLPGDCASLVSVGPDRRMRCAHLAAGFEFTGMADAMSLPDAERAARSMASSSTGTAETGRLPKTVDFLALYGAETAADLFSQISFRWRTPVRSGILPRAVPVGMESVSSPVELALAEGQHGPHGMVAGTTGAGKSEWLQTLICALAIEHDPRLVNFLLIDFKGGSSFGHFARLPHTVGIVTNLDGGLIERVLAALKGEMNARQAALRMLNLRDVTQYHRQYTASPAQMVSPSYQPLPHLFVIVDEFAQLAREFPDFFSELVRVAQLGRSLGLHLILGTQSPAEVVTEELAANLQFRVGFRVQSIEASRAVLRRPDAAYLPADWPGRAYLQVGERGVFRQFQTAYAGGDYVLERPEGEEMTLEILTEDGGVIDLLDDTQPMDADTLLPDTVARAIVELVLDYAQLNDVPFMPPLLLPPLGDRVPLRTAYTVAGITGWNGETWPQHEQRGAAPIGLTDDLTARQQGALWLDLHASTLISGAPGSGKTWSLWTLALSLSLLHSPDAIHLYALSLTDSLSALGEIPHIQPVAGADPERVRRLFRRLLNTFEARQTGETPSPMIGLLIDGFEPFRDTYYDSHLSDLERLIAEGRAHGIAVVLTATSVSALPERLRALIPRRIALRPAHPGEWAAAVGAAAPRPETSLPAGRGIVTGSPPLSVQICLPSEFPVESAIVGLRETGTEMRTAYRASTGREYGPLPVKRLPNRVPFQLVAASDPRPAQNETPMPGALSSVLGVIDDDAQSPFVLDWNTSGPHVVIAGTARSGKTNLLHAAALSAAFALSPDALRLLLVDFTGRSLRALAGLPHALHITDPQMLASALQLLNESPARAAVLIDDYDLAADVLNSEGGNLLRTLRDIARLRADTHIWATGYLDRAGDPLIRHLMMKRAGFAFGGRDALNALGLRTGTDLGDFSAPGRAVYAHDNHLTVVQTALVEDASHWVAQIHTRWGEARHPQSEARQTTAEPRPDSLLDIDTGGLIDDLLGGHGG